MKKIIDELINHSIKGVDVYRYKNATWLIYTDEVRWVIELTDEGTLWYNYSFFNNVFKYVSMELGQQTEKYIIGWANDYFYKDCAHRTVPYPMDKGRNETPNVLENGIKNVSSTRALGKDYIDKVVDEGIKETKERGKNRGDVLEWQTIDVIGKGIKEVYDSSSTHRQMRAENLMGRIVKDAKPHRVVVPAQGMDRFYYDPGCSANTTDIWMVVEEGIKEIKPSIWTTKRGVDVHDLMCSGNTTDINVIVNNGIKNIYPDQNSGDDGYNWSDEFEAGKVIEYGVKLKEYGHSEQR
jgi:hypothetical protein